MNDIIVCENLYKYFGRFCALNNLNLMIKEGEIFGLLGANGAGKTTLIRCILTFLRPSRGKVYFKDRVISSSDIQERFGFLPESFQPPQNLTARQFLIYLAQGLNFEKSKIDFLLDRIGLKEKKNSRIKNYSRGMIQRLGIAIALLKNPEILILDEPTLGLDPIGQAHMLEFLKELNSEGKTIFLTSHILSQMEKICQRIGIIHKGKIIFTGKVEEILARHNTSSLEEAYLKEVKL